MRIGCCWAWLRTYQSSQLSRSESLAAFLEKHNRKKKNEWNGMIVYAFAITILTQWSLVWSKCIWHMKRQRIRTILWEIQCREIVVYVVEHCFGSISGRLREHAEFSDSLRVGYLPRSIDSNYIILRCLKCRRILSET